MNTFIAIKLNLPEQKSLAQTRDPNEHSGILVLLKLLIKLTVNLYLKGLQLISRCVVGTLINVTIETEKPL